MNELLLICSLVFIYGAVLLAWRLFGKTGLYAVAVFCTITSNIEVLILINAFGMEQTLGNILFAASFVITDILSENVGKKAADKCVNIGILISVMFVILTQMWLHYIPVEENEIMSSIRTIFSNTPRLIIVSIAVFAITQRFDVWLYHKIWEYTSKKSNNSKSYLWFRNNAATLVSQLLNTVLFTFGAFVGVYSISTLFSILASSYLIFIFTSLLDTPVVYLARRMNQKHVIK